MLNKEELLYVLKHFDSSGRNDLKVILEWYEDNEEEVKGAVKDILEFRRRIIRSRIEEHENSIKVLKAILKEVE